MGTAGDICTSSVTCCATCKEESGVAGSTFDGGWGTRWWQNVDGGAENKEWVVGIGEDGKVGVTIYFILFYLFTLYLRLTVYKNSRLKSTIKLYSSTNN